MRNLVRILALIAAFLLIWLYFDSTGEEQEILIQEENTEPEKKQALVDSDETNSGIEMPETGLAALIGKSEQELIELYGEPQRVDPSLYDYEWWIYAINDHNYMQVGMEDEQAVTVFATGSETDVEPFKIGQAASELYASVFADTNVNIEYDNSSYRFELSEEDLNTRPIIRLGDVFALLYIDKFTGTLSSVRFVNTETLLKLRPYEMVYRGELLEAGTEAEDNDQVNRGKELQILDITNVIRVRHGMEPLEWDDQTAAVALGHSIDMFETEVFSHTSERYGELSDRLEAGEVTYLSAGENIAANYIDAPAVVEGWLNSKGHRESLLNDKFTHLGVGVYEKHYTQNFIEKWQE
ncbi:CAP domain-containing protein [Cytobacillus gottheilii]|uniref:CAP domain-containing protein n=1 Tax=Cytobacillus gottheilii TaxID=859144 RepID=A0ABX8FGL1_9BACI|nr:CAP domain-containing protein [Cytobacillus gottheilii]QVY63161.1 CAP domain-containing protein [Cytobacillus gottheilii]